MQRREEARMSENEHFWTDVERWPDFRELMAIRRRFVTLVLTILGGTTLLFLGLASVAEDFYGRLFIGGISVGFFLALVYLTIVVALAFAFLHRSSSQWDPLEQRLSERIELAFSQHTGDEASEPTGERS